MSKKELCPEINEEIYKIGPEKSISYKTACASSEDSDQPAHLCRLISVFAVSLFAVSLKTLWILDYHIVPCEDTDKAARKLRLV